MDYAKVTEFIGRKFNRCYSAKAFYNDVVKWLSWYKGYVPEFHKCKVSNGINIRERKLYRLNMAKRVCEDWSSSLLNEDINIVVNTTNEKSSIFVQGSKGAGGVLGSNNFTDIISKVLELMFALGTSAIVLGMDNAVVDSNTGVLQKNQNTRLTLSSYNATQIFPINWSNGRVRDAAFVSELTQNGKKYCVISSHILEPDGYVIYTDIIGEGSEKAQTDFGILPVIRTGSPNPLFFLFKTNIVNSVDLDSPMGVSIYADALDVVKACDVIYDCCVRDVITGQRIVMMSKNLLTTDEAGVPIVPQDVKQTYMQFFGDDSTPTENLIKEFAPDLNTEELDKEMQNQLNLLSNKVGLGTKYYNFNISSGVTATEYIGERNDFHKNAKKMSKYLESVIKQMVVEILWLGYHIVGANVDPNASVVVSTSDGVVESDTEKREQDRKDVQEGLMSAVEYRMKWYGETESEAQIAIAKIRADQALSRNNS